MILMKSVLFLPNPNVVAEELGMAMIEQVQTTGKLDIAVCQKLILDRSKMIHNRRVLSGLALENAAEAEEFVAAEEREMEREMAEAVLKELNVVTRTMEADE